MKKYAIGIDIGGTKISMVLGNTRGKILARREIPTLIRSKTPLCLQSLIQNLKFLITESAVPKAQIKGIGIGLPGAVNSKKGIVPRSPHMVGWKGIPLAKLISQKMKLPVIMGNDANAAALGARLFGEGRRKEHCLYITVSTGIGGGLIVNGHLVEGANSVGGEIGHMTIIPYGDSCNCGKQGCLEAYASGTAIVKYVKREIRRGVRTKILKLVGRHGKIRTQEVGLAAKKGDRLALAAFERAGFYLGIGIANLMNILNPAVVVLGGGVLKSAHRVFWQSMIKSCRKEAWPEAFRKTSIVQTKLGDQIGNLGALALAFEEI